MAEVIDITKGREPAPTSGYEWYDSEGGEPRREYSFLYSRKTGCVAAEVTRDAQFPRLYHINIPNSFGIRLVGDLARAKKFVDDQIAEFVQQITSVGSDPGPEGQEDYSIQ